MSYNLRASHHRLDLNKKYIKRGINEPSKVGRKVTVFTSHIKSFLKRHSHPKMMKMSFFIVYLIFIYFYKIKIKI